MLQSEGKIFGFYSKSDGKPSAGFAGRSVISFSRSLLWQVGEIVGR